MLVYSKNEKRSLISVYLIIISQFNINSFKMNNDKNIDDILASLNDDDTSSEGFNRSKKFN